MTVRELYTHVLTEINKVDAPSLLLEDFIYFLNKSVQQYTNKAYNKYDTNQQATDDLRVLKTSAKLNILENDKIKSPGESSNYYCELPADYFHLLACSVGFTKIADNKKYECDETEEDFIYYPARRLTSDMFSNIYNNSYYKPTYKRPYYYLNNINDNDGSFPVETKKMEPTNPDMDDFIKSLIGGEAFSEGRQSNSSPVLMEIKCGKTNKYFPNHVIIDYIKSPMILSISNDELDMDVDKSQVLEFPNYVCYEIINNIVTLILENSGNPRVSSNYQINTTIPGVPKQQEVK